MEEVQGEEEEEGGRRQLSIPMPRTRTRKMGFLRGESQRAEESTKGGAGEEVVMCCGRICADRSRLALLHVSG